MAFRDKYDKVTNKKAMKYYNRRKRAYRKRGGKPTPIRYSYALNPAPTKRGSFWGGRRLTGDSQSPLLITQSQTGRSRSPSTPTARKKLRFSSPGKTMVGISEKKTHYLNAENLSLDVGEFETHQLYNVAQGVLMGDRIGSSIRAHSIHINGTIRNLITSQSLVLRVLVLQDKRPQLGDRKQNFFKPKSQDNQPHNFLSTGDFSQVIEPVNTNRFRILSDRKFQLAPAVSGNQGKDNQLVSYRVKVNRNFTYLTESTLSTVEKIQPNLWMVMFCEQQGGTTGTNSAELKLNVYQDFTG